MGWGDYQTTEVRALTTISKIGTTNYNKDFVRNIQDLNGSVEYIADYMIVMQKGIDDANKDIIQKIQDFINDLIIIFTGGSLGDTGFNFGDLGYIVQALGALFGFQGVSGPINLVDAAVHFFTNFLGGTDAFGGIVNGFIKAVFEILAGLLAGVPIVGGTLHDIVVSFADNINGTHATAVTAGSTAATAQSTATTANNAATAAQSTATNAQSTATSAASTASAASSAATSANNAASAASTAASNAQAAASAAQSTASNAASVAAAAQQTADIAYVNAQYWKDEFSVSSAGVSLGKNEEALGMVMDVPPGKIRKITAARYGMLSNTGTMTIELHKITTAGVESTIATSNIPNTATKYQDNAPDYTVADGDYILANVTAMSGTVSVLHCALIGVLIDA